MCKRYRRAEERTIKSTTSLYADRVEPVVSVRRRGWSGRTGNGRRDARCVERCSTEAAEGRRTCELGSADTAIGTGSSGIDVHRSWRWATYGKVQSVGVGLRGDVKCRWRDPFAPAVSVPKCKICTSVHRSRKVILDRCVHGAPHTHLPPTTATGVR